MAGRKVPVKSVKKVGSLLSELLEIERQVSERAHELLGSMVGKPATKVSTGCRLKRSFCGDPVQSWLRPMESFEQALPWPALPPRRSRCWLNPTT